MSRGSKASYTGKQKRQAEHIEEGYEHRGVSKDEAERRAWATVNKTSGGGKKSGSGRGKARNKKPSRTGTAGAAMTRPAKTRKTAKRTASTTKAAKRAPATTKKKSAGARSTARRLTRSTTKRKTAS